jgi:glutamate formiminotransferase
MTLIAVPNVSHGADATPFVRPIEAAGARVLDVHADPIHNRSVITVTAPSPALVDAMADLAVAGLAIDLTRHSGVHPRLGGLDVCPIVPHEERMTTAIEVARTTGRAIADRAGLPIYLYGEAAQRPETKALPDLRRGGLEGLIKRCEEGLIPDLGPPRIDPRRGVVCVGAREVLIAFNVWMRGDIHAAAAIAREVRSPDVRSLGLEMGEGLVQVSMNLIAPDVVGIEQAFGLVAGMSERLGAEVTSTEIVGLVPEHYLPRPESQAARLLMQPGRSLESALSG